MYDLQFLPFYESYVCEADFVFNISLNLFTNNSYTDTKIYFRFLLLKKLQFYLYEYINIPKIFTCKILSRNTII